MQFQAVLSPGFCRLKARVHSLKEFKIVCSFFLLSHYINEFSLRDLSTELINTWKNLSEKELIAVAKKNPKAFGVLYSRNFQPVFRFVYQRIDSKETAADITQQVFLKALMNISKYEDRGYSIRSWLFRIALNELNMMFRNHKFRHTVNITDATLSHLQSEESTLHKELKTQLEKDDLITALKNIPDELLFLIEMRFFEKRSFKEMGEILGITSDNAKVRTYRAIAKLRKYMPKTRRGDEG